MPPLRLLLLALIACAAAQCPRSHSYVGFSGPIIRGQDGLAGTVVILDDCSFMVMNMRFASGVPAAYWWGTTSRSTISTGGRINNVQLQGYSGQNAMFALLPGRTWDSVAILYAWCEAFNVNLGEVTLGPGSSASPLTLPPSAPPVPEEQFLNCMPLVDGVFNLRWTLAATHIEIGLEIAQPQGTWAAFGLSRPGVEPASMVGANVVVTGHHPTLGLFATDYYLGDRNQCDYNTGGVSGVCPVPTDASPSNVTLIYAKYDATTGVRLVRYRRELLSADTSRNYMIDPQADRLVIWAYGPLSDDATRPVVLYHGTNQHSPTDLTIRFAANVSACSSVSAIGRAPQRSGYIPPPVLRGVTFFNVTTGPNPHYPNPPGWGTSYHINGLESPIIIMERGVTYTFSIAAGDLHPLYITSSKLGGRGQSNNTDEIVYAGGAEYAGTTEMPSLLVFTPDRTHPNKLYYQCFTHQKLGWEIRISSADSLHGGVLTLLVVLLSLARI